MPAALRGAEDAGGDDAGSEVDVSPLLEEDEDEDDAKTAAAAASLEARASCAAVSRWPASSGSMYPSMLCPNSMGEPLTITG